MMKERKFQVKPGTHKGNKAARLPCRGCTKNCGNYMVCEGRPWRTLSDHN